MPDNTNQSTGQQSLQSAIYQGWVWHHRHLPTEHKFRYRVFMMFVDLAEIDSVLKRSALWGKRWYHLGRFKRSDYFSINGDTNQSIDAAVRQEVQVQLGVSFSGPVFMLTNFRYFGYVTNPITCYYCFNENAKKIQALLIEVTNTPWGEKHHYVLNLNVWEQDRLVEFEKKMHVSPFMPMNRMYQWRGATPGETLRYSLASVIKTELDGDSGLHGSGGALRLIDGDTADTVQFDSGVVFKRQSITGSALSRVLIMFPFLTGKVISAIYWQAFKLWAKRIPFVPHPNKTAV